MRAARDLLPKDPARLEKTIVHARTFLGGLIGWHLSRQTGVAWAYHNEGFWPDERVDAGQFSREEFEKIGKRAAKLRGEMESMGKELRNMALLSACLMYVDRLNGTDLTSKLAGDDPEAAGGTAEQAGAGTRLQRLEGGGRTPRGAPPLDPSAITQVGLLIADKVEGPFELSVEWIRPSG